MNRNRINFSDADIRTKFDISDNEFVHNTDRLLPISFHSYATSLV